jgi:uncharacterized protein YndB with AHSA1/START domain
MDQITVEAVVKSDVETVWKYWNEPEHITKWAFADESWEASHAENDLREGGKFLTRMSAKDKSEGFDFTGTYTKVVPNEQIEYVMDDGRKVTITFETVEGGTKVTETFDPESENAAELQKSGWQAILENFKKYVEG